MWEVKIIDAGYMVQRKVYIYRRIGNDIELMLPGGGTKIIPYGASTQDEYTLLLEPETLQAFANALNTQGYKPQQGFIEGKLEATQGHLQDLRKLLKLK